MAKKKEVKEPERKYPAVVLGLDISTACIGVSVVVDDGVNKPEILELTHISPKIPSKKKGIEALILRKKIFEEQFLSRIKDKGITECIIESPIEHTAANSNSKTVAQLLQFNGLISEAIYDTLHIVPDYITSHDARSYSFPVLLSVRKFNKKGEVYDLSTIKKNLKDNHVVVFGSYPFDCDKKCVMMDMVQDMYPNINWVRDEKGELKKENYDACDSLVCALAHINLKRYGDNPEPVVKSFSIIDNGNGYSIGYTTKIWDMEFGKAFNVPAQEKKARKKRTAKG